MLHILDTSIEPPARLNNPFDYEPHELTLIAAKELRDYLSTKPEFREEIAAGKMLGVLVCRDKEGRLGFLAAYSGQLAGRADWPWFVPAVFDYLQPDGHFKQEEARISAINREIEELVGDCKSPPTSATSEYHNLTAELERVKAEGEAAVEAYRKYMQECKQRRDDIRAEAPSNLPPKGEALQAQEEELIRESQFQKAELRRIKRHWKEEAERVQEQLRPLTARIESMRQERRRRSDELQKWLFDNFILLNERGEQRSLTSIFADTPQGTPPSGAGECCAPKLLHYAFLHHLKPLCMGEFWQGRSPQMEVRHHGQFYPACRGKCKPILEWMVSHPQPLPRGGENCPLSPYPTERKEERLRIVDILYEDESIIVVNKTSGLLSVPGKQGLPSVETILSEQHGQVFMPHRLDQDTSGLLVVARTIEAYHHLQQQFLNRSVRKEYEALLDGVSQHEEGSISLPLRPDLMDRPRQLVDYVYGKTATTHYRIIKVENGQTRVLLIPHTGRTHQLRVHCAHQDGLSLPIVGDNLYGRPSQAPRLCLHARMLTFRHPVTLRIMTFTAPTPF